MIKPSGRKSPKKGPLFQTHNKIASRKNRNRRLTVAGIVAAIVSLVFWLSGASLFLHLIGVLLALIVGYALPIKQARDWALGTIAKNVGLSYQTALEYEEEESYGFTEALEEQADRAIKLLKLPPLRRWWLPLLVVAFGLTLIPLSPFRSSPRALGLPDALNPLESSEAKEATETETTAPDAPNTDPITQEPNDQAESQQAESGAPQTLDDTAGASGQGLNDISENVADQETLDRFLDNLRERDIPEEPESQSPPPPTSPQPSASENEDGEQGDPEEQTNSEGDPGENGQQAGQEGNENDPEGETAETSGENSEESDSEASDSGEQSGDSQDAQSDEQGNPSEGDESDSNGPSDSDSEASSQDGSDGSGDRSSASTPTAGIEGENENEPDFLEGQLQQGQTNLAGTVRLPGDSDQQSSTSGQSASGFQRAEEQAVTEGSIPIEYQEIIRNYFR